MSLAEHYDPNKVGGGSWLDVGRHEVTVRSHRLFNYNSGNKGVEFEVADDNGAIAKVGGFVLVEKAVWKLANFAAACGLTRSEMKRYNWEKDDKCHNILLNRHVGVTVEQVGDYKEVTDFWAVNAGADEQPKAEQKVAAKPPSNEDVPF